MFARPATSSEAGRWLRGGCSRNTTWPRRTGIAQKPKIHGPTPDGRLTESARSTMRLSGLTSKVIAVVGTSDWALRSAATMARRQEDPWRRGSRRTTRFECSDTRRRECGLVTGTREQTRRSALRVWIAVPCELGASVEGWTGRRLGPALPPNQEATIAGDHTAAHSSDASGTSVRSTHKLPPGSVRISVCEADDRRFRRSSSLSCYQRVMRVGAVGNRVLRSFPAASMRRCTLRGRQGKPVAVEDRELVHRGAPGRRRALPVAGDIAQGEPYQFGAASSLGKWPRVLMILRSRACTLSGAFVV
jgi:hypothetical protein